MLEIRSDAISVELGEHICQQLVVYKKAFPKTYIVI